MAEVPTNANRLQEYVLDREIRFDLEVEPPRGQPGARLGDVARDARSFSPVLAHSCLVKVTPQTSF